jgi:hypothetical protein
MGNTSDGSFADLVIRPAAAARKRAR